MQHSCLPLLAMPGSFSSPSFSEVFWSCRWGILLPSADWPPVLLPDFIKLFEFQSFCPSTQHWEQLTCAVFHCSQGKDGSLFKCPWLERILISTCVIGRLLICTGSRTYLYTHVPWHISQNSAVFSEFVNLPPVAHRKLFSMLHSHQLYLLSQVLKLNTFIFMYCEVEN